MSPALLALFLATFCIGTTEFVITGLLPEISRDLGVSIPSAGYLITAYALGVVVGGPLVSVATSRFPRKPMLLFFMSVFIAGHALGALAPTYEILLAARLIISSVHGSFVGLAAILAVALAPPEKSGRAIALVIGGFTVANVFGVPAGAWVGNELGWRATFWIIGGLSVLSAAFITTSLPRKLAGAQAPPALKAQFRALRRRQVWTAFVLIILMMVGAFSTITYISPLLTHVSGFAPELVPLLLFGFGLGSTLGVFLGGRLADLAPRATIILGFLAQALVFGAMFLLGGNQSAMAVLVTALGALNFSIGIVLQSLVLRGAAGAPDLAATLISSVFNLGIAVGSLVGAAALSASFGYARLPLIGALLALANASLAIYRAATPAERAAGGAGPLPTPD